MAATPNYASTPNLGAALASTADTSLTAPAAAATVWTAGASGGRIDVVHLKAVATTTASGMVRLFIHDGSTYWLLKEVPVPVVTASAANPAWSTSVTFDGGIVLESGHTLRATTNNGDDIHVIAVGGDF